MKTVFTILIVLLVGSVNASADMIAKVATAACPSEEMYEGFVQTGSIASGLSIYPSCRVIFKGMSIKDVIDRSWSTAKVIWIDINGNTRIDYVSIESIR